MSGTMSNNRRWTKMLSSMLVFFMLFSLALPFNPDKSTVKADTTNLLGNGGFEAGDLTGWNTGGNAKFTLTEEGVHAGSYALQVAGPQNWNGVKYTVQVAANKDYKLSFFGKGKGGAAYKVLAAADEATIYEGYTGDQSQWTEYAFTFNSGNNESVIIYVSDASDIAYYDSFTLLAVDEGTGVEALLQNGGFESGDLTSWSVNDTTGGGVKFTISNTEYRSGAYSLKLESASQLYDGMKNTVTVTPNTDYTFSFYMKGAGGSYFKVLAADETTIYESQTTTASDWSKRSVEFNSGSNTSIMIYVSDMAGIAYFDDFRLAEKVIPQEPAAHNVSVIGAAKAAHKLTGEYEYAHPQNVSEAYSIHTWLQADSEDGEYTVIADSYRERTFVLTDAQVGKFIKFQVTPLDAEGMPGTAVTSEAIGPVEAAGPLDQLLYELERANETLAGSVEGDAIGQYPSHAVEALEQAIAAAQALADDAAATNGQLDSQMNGLIAAQSSFEQARVKKLSQLEGFITTEGDKLMDGDEELKFISYNYPGALFNEDEQGGVMPTAFEMEDAFRTVKQTGGKVLRTYALTVKKPSHSSDVVRHIMGPGELNEEAFLAMDKLLELANEYGIRLIIPFFDHWDWPPGGISDLAAFRGIIDRDIKNKAVYTNPVLISDYKLIMDKVMNRVNSLTGVRYKDDPAIMAWETGNELMVQPAWEKEIAAHYKKVNENQLFVDGNQIYYPNATNAHSYLNITETGLTDPNFDIVKSHYYSGNYAARVKADKETVAGKKPFFVGEFGLKPTVEVEAMLNSVIDNDASGALLWSLRPHSNNGGFIRHSEYDPGDGIVYSAYHWPGLPSGDYQDSSNVVRIIREKAYEIDQLSVPSMPAPEPAPQLFASDSVGKLRWRGSTGASSYMVERAEGENGPWVVVGRNILDDVRPGENMFSDLTAETGKQYYYRVKGVNSSGESDYSNVVGPIAARYVLEDSLENNAKQYYADDASVVYRTPSAIVSFSVDAPLGDFTFHLSADGITFTEVTPTKAGDSYSYVLPEQTQATELKIVYPAGGKSAGKLAKVSIEYLGDGSTLTPIKPLVNNGVIADEMIDFASMSAHSGNVQFVQADAGLAGGDQSRLVRTNDEAAFIQYRSLGEMKALKLEVYGAQQPTEQQYFTVLGSSDGVQFTELDVEARALGGAWYKSNYEIAELPGNIHFLKIVYPAAGEDLLFPQISRLQIAVGTGEITFPVEPPAAIIDNGEYYGGESLLVNRAYSAADTVAIGLDATVKSDGQFGLKYSFQLGDATSASATKVLSAVDRSSYDTLQFWVKPDGYERQLVVRLQDSEQQSWEAKVDISGVKGHYVNLPISRQLDMSQLESFTLTVVKGNGAANGTIYFDNIQFVQTQLIDSFDAYDDAEQFAARYSKTSPVGNLMLSLDSEKKFSGTHGMKVTYDFKSDGYGGVITSLPHVDWSNYDTLQLWLEPNEAVAKLVVQVKQGNNEYFETSLDLDGSSGGRVVQLPFADFDYPGWFGSGGTLNPQDIVEFNIYLNQISGTPATGAIYIDQIELVDSNPAPAVPVGLTAAAGDGQVTLSWTANQEQDVAGYNVYVNGSETPHNTSLIERAGYTASGLSNGTAYSFQISAVDSGGKESGLSAAASATPASSGSGQGPVITGPEKPQSEEKLVVDQPKANEAGQIIVKLGANTKQVLVPGNAAALNGDNSIVLVADAVELEIPAQVVAALKGLVSPQELANGAQLSFKLAKTDIADVVALLKKGNDARIASMKAASAGYSLTLAVVAQDGQEKKLVQPADAIAMKLAFSSDADPQLLGVYLLDDAGKLQYVGGIVKDDELIVAAEGAGRYVVLQYNKSFADVSEQHWANQVVKVLTAQHVVTGVSDTQFLPDKAVTRAEFAALIVRALGLQASASGTAAFSDVDSSKWYAENIAAAFEEGIISGRSNGTFAPEDMVTREEMAIMIVKAYGVKTKQQAVTGAGEQNRFADGDSISSWAQDYVNAAVELGLVQGRGNNRFAPQAEASRAESAQIIYRLLYN